MKPSLVVLISLLSGAVGYNMASSRRAFLANAGGAAAAASVVLSSPSPSLAASAGVVKSCKSGSQNCVSRSFQAAASKDKAAEQLLSAVNSYPSSGLEDGKVDGGGYKLVEDSLSSTGFARWEFQSSGKGKLAKFFNGGKPFTDDLEVLISDSGRVDLTSSSRVGDSDFGVNAKRVAYIEAALREKGWK